MKIYLRPSTYQAGLVDLVFEYPGNQLSIVTLPELADLEKAIAEYRKTVEGKG